MTIFIGGVGQLYQGDLDLGRVAVTRLAREDLGDDVLVEELHYGAVAVAQRLQEVEPTSVIFVGAAARGRAPGTCERRSIRPSPQPAAHVQRAIGDAVTGYVTMDLAIDVTQGLGVLPRHAVAVEVEPAATETSESLTPAAIEGLERGLDLVRAEARRGPLLALVEQLRKRVDTPALEPSPALDAMNELLLELECLRDEGRWGASFTLRDRLRLAIAEGATSYGMDHLDWGLWWALIEELDRLQPLEGGDLPH